MTVDELAASGPAVATMTTGPVNGPFLTVAEVAARMRVSKMTVYRHVHSGELPAIRFGRSFRVQRRAVEELIEGPEVDALV